MANLNKVMLIGNLTRDPEVRFTPKGTAVTDLGLAVNRIYATDSGERREETTFVDITLWGRQAEIAGQYMKKGKPIYIEGRLQMDTWQDKQTGQNRTKLKIIGENFQFLGGRDESSGGGGGASQGSYSSASQSGGGGEPHDEPSHQRGGSDPGYSSTPSPSPSQGGGADFSEEEDDIPF